MALAEGPRAGDAAPEVEAWEQLYDGRLWDAAWGDPTAAVVSYSEARNRLSEDDPLTGEVRYWMALARFEEGDLAAAREEIEAALTVGDLRTRARALLGRLDAEDNRVRALPYVQDFATSTAPWVRAWTLGSREDLRLETVDDAGTPQRVASWHTVVRQGEDDFLFIPMGDQAKGPQRVELRMRARAFPAHVRFVLEDHDGQQWSGQIHIIPNDRFIEVQLPLSEFVLVGDPRSGRRPVPTNIRSLMLVDVTGFRSSDRGENWVLIDRLEVR